MRSYSKSFIAILCFFFIRSLSAQDYMFPRIVIYFDDYLTLGGAPKDLYEVRQNPSVYINSILFDSITFLDNVLDTNEENFVLSAREQVAVFVEVLDVNRFLLYEIVYTQLFESVYVNGRKVSNKAPFIKLLLKYLPITVVETINSFNK